MESGPGLMRGPDKSKDTFGFWPWRSKRFWGTFKARAVVTVNLSLRGKRFSGVREQRVTARKMEREGKEGRKRLQTNPRILKTSHTHRLS